VHQLHTQSSVKKCLWHLPREAASADDLMMTSISTDKCERRVSVWHLQKPYLQQHILKGVPEQEDFTDFQWLKPAEHLLCAQGTCLIIYDLRFYDSEERARHYR